MELLTWIRIHKNAAAGIMGNMSVESAGTFDGRIVQGDYDSSLAYSIDYTKRLILV